MRAKIAAIFACIESTQLVTQEHWQMAKTVVDASTTIRKWLEGQAAEAAEEAADERLAERVACAEATAAATRCAETNAARAETTVLNYPRDHPGASARTVRNNGFKEPRRKLARTTVDRLIVAGKVKGDDGKLSVV